MPSKIHDTIRYIDCSHNKFLHINKKATCISISIQILHQQESNGSLIFSSILLFLLLLMDPMQLWLLLVLALPGCYFSPRCWTSADPDRIARPAKLLVDRLPPPSWSSSAVEQNVASCMAHRHFDDSAAAQCQQHSLLATFVKTLLAWAGKNFADVANWHWPAAR